MRERCKLPSGVWGGAAAEIEFGAFKPKSLTSGGNNVNDFPENQLTRKYSVDHKDDGTAISGGGTPNTGGGTAFRPDSAEFNHWISGSRISSHEPCNTSRLVEP